MPGQAKKEASYEDIESDHLAAHKIEQRDEETFRTSSDDRTQLDTAGDRRNIYPFQEGIYVHSLDDRVHVHPPKEGVNINLLQQCVHVHSHQKLVDINPTKRLIQIDGINDRGNEGIGHGGNRLKEDPA
jgi:hypothetical protein